MSRPHIDCCSMPEPAPRNEAHIYRSIRDTIVRSKCEAGRGHLCCGKITIERDAVTLNCALCGDLRQLLDAESAL